MPFHIGAPNIDAKRPSYGGPSRGTDQQHAAAGANIEHALVAPAVNPVAQAVSVDEFP